MKYVPERIKELRGITSAEDLVYGLRGVGLKITRQTLHNWETGETSPTVNQITLIADYFGVDVSQFFERETGFNDQNLLVDDFVD